MTFLVTEEGTNSDCTKYHLHIPRLSVKDTFWFIMYSCDASSLTLLSAKLKDKLSKKTHTPKIDIIIRVTLFTALIWFIARRGRGKRSQRGTH